MSRNFQDTAITTLKYFVTKVSRYYDDKFKLLLQYFATFVTIEFSVIRFKLLLQVRDSRILNHKVCAAG